MEEGIIFYYPGYKTKLKRVTQTRNRLCYLVINIFKGSAGSSIFDLAELHTGCHSFCIPKGICALTGDLLLVSQLCEPLHYGAIY